MILPAKYIQTEELMVAAFPGIVYMLNGKPVINLFTWSPNASVVMALQLSDDLVYHVRHVFVGAYIDKCIKLPQDQIEVFKLYISKGDLPDEPTDLIGEVVNKHIDSDGYDVWMSYEHICGPWLLDPREVVSDVSQTNGKLSVDAPIDIIPNRRIYLNNPLDLLQLGILNGDSQVEVDMKHIEELLFRSRDKKTRSIN